jgi:hypothetical protein
MAFIFFVVFSFIPLIFDKFCFFFTHIFFVIFQNSVLPPEKNREGNMMLMLLDGEKRQVKLTMGGARYVLRLEDACCVPQGEVKI